MFLVALGESRGFLQIIPFFPYGRPNYFLNCISILVNCNEPNLESLMRFNPPLRSVDEMDSCEKQKMPIPADLRNQELWENGLEKIIDSYFLTSVKNM